MPVKILFIISLILGMTIRFTNAQSDPCSPSVVRSSFYAAVLSEDLDSLVSSYVSSDCPANVIHGVETMARGYSELKGDHNQTSEFPLIWRGFLFGIDGIYFHRLEFELNSQNRLQGKASWSGYKSQESANYSNSNLIEGTYYSNLNDIPDRTLWSVIDGWDGDNVISWLKWKTTRNLSGNARLDVLWVAIITSNGVMRVGVYDSPAGGRKGWDGVYWTD